MLRPSLRGCASQEVWDVLYPALGLANSFRRNDALVPTLFGLWANTFTTGRVAESLCWFTQILDAAAVYGDPALEILGHYTAVVNYFYLGDLVNADSTRVICWRGTPRSGMGI